MVYCLFLDRLKNTTTQIRLVLTLKYGRVIEMEIERTVYKPVLNMQIYVRILFLRLRIIRRYIVLKLKVLTQ